MSARSTKSRRRASGSPAVMADDEDNHTQFEEPLASKRSRSRGTSSQGLGTDAFPLPVTATPAADERELAALQHQPARIRQPRIQFNQQEALRMEELIQQYNGAADEAQGKAVDLAVPQTSLDAMVAKVVRFMLFKNFEKPGVPVKRQELVEVIQKDQKGGRHAKKLPAIVIPLAAGKLASVFGLEMRELNKQPAAAAAAARRPEDAAAADGSGTTAASTSAGSGGQSYVLQSLLPSELLTHFVQNRGEDAGRGLTVVVLGLLQLNGGKMPEDELWRHLAQLGVQQEDQGPNQFGRKGAHDVLAHLERARYLVKRKEANPAGGMQTMLSWGETAQDEFGGQQLKQVVDQLLAAGGRALPEAEDDGDGDTA